MNKPDYIDEPWEISDEQKLRFAGLFLIEYIINKPKLFKVWLDRDDSDLEPILEWLLVQEWIDIKDEDHYQPNDKGRKVLELFMRRYAEFLYFFDVFSGVDLGEGQFAFERYFDFDDDAAWLSYLEDERFDDLRIAVAEFLDIDAVEIVFMQFMREERFGHDATGWQFDLLLGTIWDEILEVCNEATDVYELGYDCEEGRVSGEAVMGDILGQGAQLLGNLLHRAQREIAGIPHSNDAATPSNSQSFVVPPVTFPPASQFNFNKYAPGKKHDDLWDEIEQL